MSDVPIYTKVGTATRDIGEGVNNFGVEEKAA